MTKKILLPILLLVFLLSSCAWYNRSNWPWFVTQLSTANLEIIEAHGIDKNGHENKLGGTAIPIGDGYVVALTHCTDVSVRTVYSFMGPLEIPFNAVKIKYTIGNHKFVLVDRHEDLSLFHSLTYDKKYSMDFDEDFDVRIGDKILIVGNSFLGGNNIKVGVVASFDIDIWIKRTAPQTLGIKKSDFMISADVNPGDSGSPVIAMGKYGTPKIIGIVRSAMAHGAGFASRSDYVVRKVKEFKEKSDKINEIVEAVNYLNL